MNVFVIPCMRGFTPTRHHYAHVRRDVGLAHNMPLQDQVS
jgi:hypothetical protein